MDAFFEFYLAREGWFASGQLSFAMLGMGATLAVSDFTKVFTIPKAFLLGMGSQLIIVPLLAWLFIVLIDITPGLAVGLALCAAIPGGTISNIFTLFARGDIALSISLSAVTTILCLVSTPLVLSLLIGNYMPENFTMPAAKIAFEIALYLLLPLMVGMLVRRYFLQHSETFSKWCIRASLIIIFFIVIGALGSGRLDFVEFGWANVFLTIAFALLLMVVSGVIPWVLQLTLKQVAAINIEVMVRSVNLGLLVFVSLFPVASITTIEAQVISNQALFTLLLYGGCQLVGGPILIMLYRKLIK